MRPDNMNLRELQNLLYQRITNLDTTKESLGDERGLAPGVFEALVHGDERLSAVERVDIYANAYFYRLLDCLSEDFPATLVVLGADNFAALVKEYLLEHPPTEPSILYAGLYLADFLNDHPFAERWPLHRRPSEARKDSSRCFPCHECPRTQSRNSARGSFRRVARP